MLSSTDPRDMANRYIHLTNRCLEACRLVAAVRPLASHLCVLLALVSALGSGLMSPLPAICACEWVADGFWR